MRLTPLVFVLALACTPVEDEPKPDDTQPADDTGSDTDGSDTALDNPPSMPEVAITPSAPVESQDLTVTIVTPSVDPEGAEVTYRYAWTVDGVARDDLVAATVPGSETVDAQTWGVTVTPNDGTLDGPAATAAVVIGNQPPTAPTIRLTPESPTPDDALVLVFDVPASDPNGDPLTQTIRWYEDDSAAISFNDLTEIGAQYVDGGETWRVVVTVTDGVYDPVSVETSVTIANTPPEVGTPRISPTNPKDGNDLTVTVTADDADGNELAYTYVWYRDGVEATDVGNTDTVPASATTVGEEWGVTVTVSDGYVDVSESAATVEILDWEGVSYTHNLSMYLANDAGSYPLASGAWSAAILTQGSRVGENECDLYWEIDATEDARVCPRCDFAFSGTMTLDTAVSTSSGRMCDAYYGDGRFQWSFTERSMGSSAYGQPRGSGGYYYGGLSLYAYGTGGYSYSGYGYTFARYYEVTRTEDSYGNVTVDTYQYFTYRF